MSSFGHPLPSHCVRHMWMVRPRLDFLGSLMAGHNSTNFTVAVINHNGCMQREKLHQLGNQYCMVAWRNPRKGRDHILPSGNLGHRTLPPPMVSSSMLPSKHQTIINVQGFHIWMSSNLVVSYYV